MTDKEIMKLMLAIINQDSTLLDLLIYKAYLMGRRSAVEKQPLLTTQEEAISKFAKELIILYQTKRIN